ncbi:hypothetical protein BDV59DRAFT_14784 [Aspergillus ambiguus]|uniref:UBX domain protein n=1 Tax=Aspergillus ambiguus TaxID=176160 RepID=UPI003CCD6114
MPATFFSGSLQEGIALAVSQAKAVICFVRDDGETSSKWEDEYLSEGEFTELLATKSVLLRLPKDSQEAGFLTSFCPITKFPTVVVIKNGMLREYIVPEISRDDFRARLRATLDDSNTAEQAATASSSAPQSRPTAPTVSSARAPESPTSTPSEPPQAPQPQTRSDSTDNNAATEQRSQSSQSTRKSQPPASKPQPPKPKQKLAPSSPSSNQEARPKESPKPKINITKRQPTIETVNDTQEKPRTPATSPPQQYRLQVRLFDGSSIRSSFAPSQTIGRDVRPWIDSQMVEGKRPYTLKHILTPLPNHTLTIAEEERKLEELGLGPSANLVMVPINSYTEAYSSSGSSLPVRAVSSVYGLVSSAAGMATGLVGSFLGYGQASSSETPPASNGSSSGSNTPRPRAPASRGPNIRTLRDQQGEQDDRQFYNGNQLNFEPRRDTDSQ